MNLGIEQLVYIEFTGLIILRLQKVLSTIPHTYLQ